MLFCQRDYGFASIMSCGGTHGSLVAVIVTITPSVTGPKASEMARLQHGSGFIEA